jgi:hypothetical protein
MTIAATPDLEHTSPNPLIMRLAVAAVCAALADWLLIGLPIDIWDWQIGDWQIGLSLPLFLGLIGIVAVTSNGVFAARNVQIIMVAVLVVGLLALVEDVDFLSVDRVRIDVSGGGCFVVMMKNASVNHGKDERRSPTVIRACLCLSIIASGLALRGFGLNLGLPASIVKYGGSVLWGTMVFFLVAIAASGLSRRCAASVAALIAICVELFRLVHTPWLDAFRLTLPGALLLGRIFSPWNMLAYGIGLLLALLLDRLATSLSSSGER